MIERLPTGNRIRERRQERGLRQAELAASVGISPSYLNLIEHGRRRIAGKLLADLARALDLEPAALGEAGDASRLHGLRAAAAAAEALRPQPEATRAQDFLDRFPGWATLVASQGRRIEALEGRVAELAGRLSHDHGLAEALHQVISGVTAIRATSGILAENPDLDREWQARFLRNIRADSEALAESSRSLVRFLEAPARVAPLGPSPQEEVERWLDVRDHHLPEVEAGERLQGPLPDGPAGALLHGFVVRYASDAAALPLGPFADAARDCGYDPAALARRFDAPFLRVLRRLATLPPGQGHPTMGLLVCDASGTLTFAKAPEGLEVPRAGGCPLWPLFEALAQPGRPLRLWSALPGQRAPRFLCHAIAAPPEVTDWSAPPLAEAAMLLTPAPPGPEPGDRLVGPSCRLCPRKDCPARREPSILG